MPDTVLHSGDTKREEKIYGSFFNGACIVTQWQSQTLVIQMYGKLMRWDHLKKHGMLSDESWFKRTWWVGGGEITEAREDVMAELGFWGTSWRSLGKERCRENPKQKELHEQSLLVGGSMVILGNSKGKDDGPSRSRLCCGHVNTGAEEGARSWHPALLHLPS